MAKIRIIVMVGASLLENAAGKRREQLHECVLRQASKGSTARCDDSLQDWARELITMDNNIPELTQPEISPIVADALAKDLSTACAELSSLWGLRCLTMLNGTHSPLRVADDDSGEVYLVCTKGNRATGDAGTCAYAERISAAAAANDSFAGVSFQVLPIDGGVDDAGDYEKAIEALVETLQTLESDSSELDRTYIVITGGYKGFTPWLSLWAFLHDDTYLVYTHETHATLVHPGLFLQPDVSQMDDMRSALQRETIDEGEWRLLPTERFRSLYRDDAPPGTYRLNALGRLARSFFSDPGLRYGYGRPLLRLLERRPSGPPLAQDIRDRLPYWEHLWIGDQIPETVEHSRRHSMRLQEYAYWMLTLFPALQEKLGAVGLYMLICAIWLHDIGHGALLHDGLPIALLPSLVRDRHAKTSAEIILGKGWLPPKALPLANYRKAVSLVALHHNLPLLAATPPTGDSLQEHAAVLTDSQQKQALVAAALLSLVDALDQQAERCGTTAYQEMHECRVCYEVGYVLQRLRSLGGKAASVDWSAECERLWAQYHTVRSLEIAAHSEFKDRVGVQIREIAKCFQSATPADREILSYASQALFKMLQFWHFARSSAIALVSAGAGRNVDGQPQLKVTLRYRSAVPQAKDIATSVSTMIEGHLQRVFEVQDIKECIPGGYADIDVLPNES